MGPHIVGLLSAATEPYSDNLHRLRREEESLDNIKQYYVCCRSKEEKYQAITNIYGVLTIGQAMIFCHVSLHI